jgi:hypothetical protein
MNAFKKTLIAGLLGVALYVGIYLYALKSDGFRFVQHVIEGSPSIQQKFGSPITVSLPFFGAFKERFVDSDKQVNMVLRVKGTIRSERLSIEASRKNGAWKIESATENGKEITIAQ